MAITKEKARAEGLIDKRLKDMGLEEMGQGAEVRDAARAYYAGLVQEHLANTEESALDDCVDDYEGMVWGFVAGYQACLKAQS